MDPCAPAAPPSPLAPAAVAPLLPPPSPEQQLIVEAVRNGKNVLVDAVAGSGKTTSILHIARAMPEASILLLTYNKRLKEETRDRARSLRLKDNLEIHTFHSACWRYFSPDCKTDAGLVSVVQGLIPRRVTPVWSLVVIDEAQDVTDLLYGASIALLRGQRPQMVLLGDERQAVYCFKGSDARYLTHAADVWPARVGPWESCRLSTSFRVTGAMAEFVSCVLVPQAPMYMRAAVSAAWGGPVMYVVGDPFSTAVRVAHEIVQMIKREDAAPEDIFLLASSVKPPSNKFQPLHTLCNELTKLVREGGGEAHCARRLLRCLPHDAPSLPLSPRRASRSSARPMMMRTSRQPPWWARLWRQPSTRARGWSGPSSW